LLESLAQAGTLLVAGEAGSHCVKATMEHYVQYMDDDAPKRIVLLTDCMSPINGFEEPYHAFLEDMQKRGAQLLSSTAWLKQVSAS